MMMRIGIAADHGGFELKERLVIEMKSLGHELVEFGAREYIPDDDYPGFVVPLAQTVMAEVGTDYCLSSMGVTCPGYYYVEPRQWTDIHQTLAWRSDLVGGYLLCLTPQTPYGNTGRNT